MGLWEFCIKSWNHILKTPTKQSLWTEEDFCSKYDIHHQIDRLFFQYLYSQKSQNVCVCKLLMLVYICRREKAISEREREREREIINLWIFKSIMTLPLKWKKEKKKKNLVVLNKWSHMVPINRDIENAKLKTNIWLRSQIKKEKTYEIQKLGWFSFKRVFNL